MVGLKSTQVIASNPAPAEAGEPFTGEFLADHYRDISFYDEYVFPVTCERHGIPGGRDPGGFESSGKAESSAGEAKGAKESIIAVGRERGSRC